MERELREKAYRYLAIFGLHEKSTLAELNQSYRTLAKLYHPDVNRDVRSEERMIIINEGYYFLRDVIEKGLLGDISQEPLLSGDKDPYYRQYKRGFQILQTAFDDYFGEGDKQFEGKFEMLAERLRRAKQEFSLLVTGMPYNQWVDDAIEKIHSINKWIE
jgi:curved DNA-binding protein CbpA